MPFTNQIEPLFFFFPKSSPFSPPLCSHFPLPHQSPSRPERLRNHVPRSPHHFRCSALLCDPFLTCCMEGGGVERWATTLRQRHCCISGSHASGGSIWAKVGTEPGRKWSHGSLASSQVQTGQGFDGSPRCFSGEGRDQVGEPQNLGKPSGGGLLALFVHFFVKLTHTQRCPLEGGTTLEQLPPLS